MMPVGMAESVRFVVELAALHVVERCLAASAELQ
jgi:hypothetical protein